MLAAGHDAEANENIISKIKTWKCSFCLLFFVNVYYSAHIFYVSFIFNIVYVCVSLLPLGVLQCDGIC